MDAVEDWRPNSPPNWPPPLGSAAFYGLAGKFVNLVQPHTEADPAALLVQFLAAMGNLIGRGPFFKAGADKHYMILFPAVTGDTSKARKGMSWGHVKDIMRRIDQDWAGKCVKIGLASGEGVIAALESPPDKRLLMYESEFSKVLKVAERSGSTLSDIIRQAWDCEDLSVLTRNNPLEVKAPHISVVGHITLEELRSLLTDVDSSNGFANRFLWVGARRSNSLPDGGTVPEQQLNDLALKLKFSVKAARKVGLIGRDLAANRLWTREYDGLAEGKHGRFGAVIARAEAQVMRLACVYALLDSSSLVREVHLLAALEVWRYCEDSARFIFGNGTGDPVADRILVALRRSSAGGLTRTEITDRVLQRNTPSKQIECALRRLSQLGLAQSAKDPPKAGQAKPTEKWFAAKRD